MTDQPSHNSVAGEGLAQALEGDPSAVDDDEGAPIGVRDTRELAALAARVAEIGQSARNRFGERLVALADQLADLAADARRRLAGDRLPPDAGTPEQRRDAAADDLLPEP
jgi:hypothetical protein